MGKREGWLEGEGGHRRRDGSLCLGSPAEKLLRNQETNISIFGKEDMRELYIYFPLFLINPLLLSLPGVAKCFFPFFFFLHSLWPQRF